MLFSSPIFLFAFLPFTLLSYYLIPNPWKNFWLVILSIIFYSWGESSFTLNLLALIFINYLFGIGIEKSPKNQKKLLLILSILANLAVLFYYKYLTFFLTNLNQIFESLNYHKPETIYLPLALSFFTFHAISYNFDIFRQKSPAQKNPIKLSLYLLFFPHLIAGPIIRYHNLADQIEKRLFSLPEISYGIERFIFGLAKKLLIADTLSVVVDEIFATPTAHLSPALAWLGIICFTLQIYFDFSGYSDMAIGLARMFGFKFPENFNYPYISSSIKEFWTRWHISLSTWLRDYLYIPLGGNRISLIRTISNLFIVFLLGGLWHGANWTFIVWGAIYGGFLSLERVFNLNFFWKPFQHLYTLLVVMISWVFFRSESVSYALNYLKLMFGLVDKSSLAPYHPLIYFLRTDVLLVLFFGIIFSLPLPAQLIKLKEIKFIKPFSPGINISLFAFTVLILYLSLIALASQTFNPFIYFRF